MKIKKIISFFICCYVFALCAFADELDQKIRIGILNGPSCVPCANLIGDNNYSFSRYADPQALLPKMIKNEVDVGFLPVNVAAKVYNSSNQKIIVCAVTGNGNLKLLSRNKNLKRLSDLNTSTVFVAGRGATPEYMFKYLLNKNNMDYETKNGVNFDFSVPPAQLPAMLISGKIDYAVLPEPFVTIALMKSKDVYEAVDFQKEYKYFSNAEVYPLTVMVVRSDYASEHQQELEALFADYEKALKATLKNPKKTGKLCEQHELGLTAEVVTVAIPKSNYIFVPANKAVGDIERLLNIFLENEPSSIGEKLPDAGFYYNY